MFACADTSTFYFSAATSLEFIAGSTYLVFSIRDFKECWKNPSVLPGVRKAARAALWMAVLFFAATILTGRGIYVSVREQERSDPQNQPIVAVTASGSLAVSGFDWDKVVNGAVQLLLDFHQRADQQNIPLLSFERDDLQPITTNEYWMRFKSARFLSMPTNTVGGVLRSVDACTLLFVGVPVSREFRVTGGAVTLTLNGSIKKFRFPPQQLPSAGSITVVAVMEGTNVSHVAWTSERKYRLE